MLLQAFVTPLNILHITIYMEIYIVSFIKLSQSTYFPYALGRTTEGRYILNDTQLSQSLMFYLNIPQLMAFRSSKLLTFNPF